MDFSSHYSGSARRPRGDQSPDDQMLPPKTAGAGPLSRELAPVRKPLLYFLLPSHFQVCLQFLSIASFICFSSFCTCSSFYLKFLLPKFGECMDLKEKFFTFLSNYQGLFKGVKLLEAPGEFQE